MKKLMGIGIIIMLVMSLTACGQESFNKDGGSVINENSNKEIPDKSASRDAIVLFNKNMADIVNKHSQEELKNMYEKNEAFEETIYKAVVDMDNDNIMDTIEISFYMKVRYNDASKKYGFGYEVSPDYYTVKINDKEKEYVLPSLTNILLINQNGICKLKFDSSYRQTDTYYLSYINNEIVEEKAEEMYSLEKVILKETNKSLDECILHNVDIDFDGIYEVFYYPSLVVEHVTEGSLYGVTKDGTFGKLLDESCGTKLELLENPITKEKFYICNVFTHDGLCYTYEEIFKIEKVNGEIILTQLFLENCNSEAEKKTREELRNTLTEAEYEDVIFNTHISEYNAYGKEVTEEEYNKVLLEFKEKYNVLSTFEVPN